MTPGITRSTWTSARSRSIRSYATRSNRAARSTRRSCGSPSTQRSAARPLRAGSIPDHLDQHALLAAAVELAVEDLFPRAEVELSLRHRDDDLPPHDLALVMRVAVVL